MKINEIFELTDINAYTDKANEEKKTFHSEAKKLLRAIAKDIGIDRSDFSVKGNLAGAAISGEITLHASNIHLQISNNTGEAIIRYRTCKGRSDYTGGPNNVIKILDLQDTHKYDNFIGSVKKMIGEKLGTSASLEEKSPESAVVQSSPKEMVATPSGEVFTEDELKQEAEIAANDINAPAKKQVPEPKETAEESPRPSRKRFF